MPGEKKTDQQIAQDKSLELSIVIPVYNSSKIVSKTVQETVKSLNKTGLIYEIVLVNDGSPDQSWEILKSLRNEHSNLRIINLIKNYGQHSAVFCGIENSVGKYIVTMDDDLQNPPEEIIKLYKKITVGYDLVFAEFNSKKHAEYRKLGSRIVNFLNKKIFKKPQGVVLTNFRIFTRAVADRVVSHNTFYPYIPGLLLMYSSSVANVTTDHHPRSIGGSNYSLKKIIKLVFRILFNYSVYPLNVILTIGIIGAIFSFLLSMYFIAKALLIGTTVPGWTTVVVLISFFNGVLLLTFGIVGQYIVRIMNQLAQSKPYIIKDNLSSHD